jgi:hypothetical protein
MMTTRKQWHRAEQVGLLGVLQQMPLAARRELIDRLRDQGVLPKPAPAQGQRHNEVPAGPRSAD